MAEEILVKESLTQEMISGGEEVGKALKESGLPIDALFWLYTSESNAWRLTIASSMFQKQSLLKGYTRVSKILNNLQINPPNLGVSDLSIIRSDDDIVEALASLNRTRSLAGQRVTRTLLYWVYIEDAYVYFI